MSGKTVIGKHVANKLGKEFIDVDDLIILLYKQKKNKSYSCREIFLEEGEEYFRQMEKDAVESLVDQKGVVIALGGGTLTSTNSVELLRQWGTIIYLKASPDTIWSRICLRGIPPYVKERESFNALIEKRIPVYENAAHHTIETEQQAEEEVAMAVINKWNVTDGE